MSEPFDPYYRWLGIPAAEQPPNHYRLLGLELFESNRQVIDSVAMRHITFLQDITDGPQVKDAQRLLNELAAARRCLLNADNKAAYDQELRARLAEQSKPPKASPAPQKPEVKPPPKSSAVQNQGIPAPPVAASPRTKPAGTRSSKIGGKYWAVGGAATVLCSLVIIGIVALGGGDVNGPPAASEEGPSSNPQLAVAADPSPTIDHADQDPTPVEPATDEDTAVAPLPVVPVELTDLTETADQTAADAESTVEPPESLEMNAEITETIGAIRDDGLPTTELVLWLDAADSTALDIDSDGRVREWLDRSDTNSDAKSDRASERPSLVSEALSGKPVIRFSGAQCQGVGTGDTLNVGADFTMVFLSRGQQGALLAKGCGEQESEFSLVDGGGTFWAAGERHAMTEEDSADFAVRTVVADGRTIAWFVNGSPAGTSDGTACRIDTRFKFRIGCATITGADLPDAFIGDLAELLIYDVPLNSAERTKVESYLQEKWLGGEVAPLPMELAANVEPTTPVEPAEDTLDVPAAEPALVTDGNQDAESDSNVAPSNEPEPPEPAEDQKVNLWINVGGDDYTDPTTNVNWIKCPGDGFDCEGGRKASETDAPNPVMGSAERGLNAFRAQVPNGTYEVNLFFCDYWSSDPTDRLFKIYVEQKVVAPRFSPLAAGGGRGNPSKFPLSRVTINDGRLDIDFEALAGTTILNGVSIQQR